MFVFLREMERKRKKEPGQGGKIEMTNGLVAHKRYARRLIRHFNLDSAGRVCSALRRANRWRGSQGKLKNVRA